MAVWAGRDREDLSITGADKRRDFMVFAKNMLVVGGEDKPNPADIKVVRAPLISLPLSVV